MKRPRMLQISGSLLDSSKREKIVAIIEIVLSRDLVGLA